MRFVISGGTGFVGKWIVNEILKYDNEVILLTINEQDKPIEFLNNDRVSFVVCPLNQLESIDPCSISDKEIDVFIHLAWVGTSGTLRKDEAVQLNNVKYACDAVRFARKLKAKKFLNAGSIMEYEAFYTLTSNDKSPNPNMIYSIGKLAEDLCCKTLAAELGIDYCNVIIGNIYGVGEKSQRFINVMVKKLMKNEPLDLTECTQVYDFIYASDAAEAIYRVAQRGEKNNSYYIGHSFVRPLKDFVLDMKKILCSNSKINFGAVPFTNFALTYEEFDIHSLDKLGFIPKISFEEGITKMKEWLEKEGIE